jgi:hypothetical protein
MVRIPPAVVPDSYWVTELFAAGEYPGALSKERAARQIHAFEAAGMRLFVDLTHPADGLEPYEHLLTSGRRSAHPIVDMSIPTKSEMAALLDEVDTAHSRGERVYVHCWGGCGRTGIAVGCWLVRHGTGSDEAIELIRERRRLTPDFQKKPDSPMTADQRAFVHDWPSGR